MGKLEIKIVYNKPGVETKHAVIWLHGLGADNNDFVPIVPELNLKIPIKFIFPNAPIIPITINGGMRMRGWYDIANFNDLHREVDTRGILNSVSQIEALITDLTAEGFNEKNIVIAGFSQGGVITYYTGLTTKYNLAGLAVLSGYLPDISLLDVAKIQHRTKLPILICHGNQDQVVNIRYARSTAQHLERLGLSYEWQEYPMAHNVCYEEIFYIGKWLEKVLKS